MSSLPANLKLSPTRRDLNTQFPQSVIGDLFENAPKVRHVDIDSIEAFVIAKLKAIFPHVEKPARLLGSTKAPLFNLFFAMANPSPAAIKVGSAIARHLLQEI
jgi:hypothetical protein